MNKTQLINQVARKTHLPKNTAKQVVNACFMAIKKSTKVAGGVSISGFGRFWFDQTTGRRVYNTKTRRSAWTKGPKTVCFKPTKRW